MLLTIPVALRMVQSFAQKNALPSDLDETSAAEMLSVFVTSRHPEFSDDFTHGALANALASMDIAPT